MGSLSRASAAIASLADKGACFMSSLAATHSWLVAVPTPSPVESFLFGLDCLQEAAWQGMKVTNFCFAVGETDQAWIMTQT